ncbi:uncharacterized protein VTP21DRAFT_2731 [Calcarisporiella thermophila]|uniref:uncharacterized protein n=1 Tax=Calcarisporiella thermophila TaxID=911321 RepID=UPI0037433E1F
MSSPGTAGRRKGKSRRSRDLTHSSPGLQSPRRSGLKKKSSCIVSDDGVNYINIIPIELLTHILSYLEPASLSTAAQVCRLWHHVVTDDSCWRNAFFKFFGCSPYRRLSTESWRSEYLYRSHLLRKWQQGKGRTLLYDLRNGKIDEIYCNFKDSWMLAGSLERNMVVRSDPSTGKIDKYPIVCPIGDVSAIKIDHFRILWGSTTGHVALTLRAKSLSHRVRYFNGLHEGAVSCLAWSTTTTSLVLSGGADGLVKVWSTATGRCLAHLTGSSSRVLSLSFHPRMNVIATSASGTVLIWDLDITTLLMYEVSDIDNEEGANATIPSFAPARRILATLPILSLEYDSVTASIIITHSRSNELLRYCIKTGECKSVFSGGHTADISCMRWDKSYEGWQTSSVQGPSTIESGVTLNGFTTIRLIVSGDITGIICFWDSDFSNQAGKIKKVSPLKIIDGHHATITSLHIDPFCIISGSEDGWVKAWDPLSGKHIRTLHARSQRNSERAPVNELSDTSQHSVRHIHGELDHGVIVIGGQVKAWYFSSARSLKGRHKQANGKSRHVGISSKHRLNLDIAVEIRESRRELEQERRAREERQKNIARSNPLPELNEDELLEYAMMVSRDEQAQNPYSDLQRQEEQDLVEAVIQSLAEEGNRDERDAVESLPQLPSPIFAASDSDMNSAASSSFNSFREASPFASITSSLSNSPVSSFRSSSFNNRDIGREEEQDEEEEYGYEYDDERAVYVYDGRRKSGFKYTFGSSLTSSPSLHATSSSSRPSGSVSLYRGTSSINSSNSKVQVQRANQDVNDLDDELLQFVLQLSKEEC